MVIGIIGKSGSGKSTAAKYLAEKYAFNLIDLDQIGKQVVDLYPAILVEIVSSFGSEFVTNGKLNRASLGKLVFGNPSELAKLNNIFFKYITQEIEVRIAKYPDNILEGAVLTELGIDDTWDKLFFIQSPESEMIARLQRRENTPLEVLQKRIESQGKYDVLANKADFVITNSDSTDALFAGLDNAMSTILD